MDHVYNSPPGAGAGSDPASQRNDARDSLFLVAVFRVVGGKHDWQVRVRNLSAGGLMAEFPHPLAMGTEVEVDVRGIGWVTGRVAWATAGRVGVAFDEQIDPKMARKPVTSGTTTPSFVKPILPRR